MENNIRDFRLRFEELVSEGRCKGSVIKRYASFPLMMARTVPGLSNHDNKIISRKLLEVVLSEFKDYVLTIWDKVEDISYLDFNGLYEGKENIEEIIQNDSN